MYEFKGSQVCDEAEVSVYSVEGDKGSNPSCGKGSEEILLGIKDRLLPYCTISIKDRWDTVHICECANSGASIKPDNDQHNY